MTIAWPIATLPPRNIARRLVARTTAGVVSASGFTQRVSVPAHVWVIEYEGIVVATDTQRRVWDSFDAMLDGGANPIVVPLVNTLDWFGLATGATVGAYAAGVTVMTVRRVGAVILPGYHFTIGERLYRVAGSTPAGGDDYLIAFRPPLREAAGDLNLVTFDVLHVKCRLASDDEMALKFDPARIGIGNVNFIEDPQP